MGRQNRKKRKQVASRMPVSRTPQRLNPDNLAPLVCLGCGCETFQEFYELKLLPAELSSAGMDQYLPLKKHRCEKCGQFFNFREYMKVVSESLKDAMREVEITDEKKENEIEAVQRNEE